MFRRFATAKSLPALTVFTLYGKRFCIPIKVPFIAESISSGKVIEWKKAVGDTVEEDEVICRIESDKLAVDVRVPKDGALTQVDTADGKTVNVGDVLATMKEGIVEKKTVQKVLHPAPHPLKDASSERLSSVSVPITPASTAPRPPATTSVPLRAVDSPTVVQGSDPRVHYVRISSMRQRIADRLKASQNTAAMLTTFNEIDMTPLFALREKYKEDFLKRHGVKLGFMSPFAKACAIALKEVPVMNASFGTETIEYHDYVDISIAVATPTGLVVPVLRDVQNMNLADIEKKIEDYSQRAKENKITLPEMTGGTFTISNGGTFGSWMGTPIINPPQSAILGMHAIKKKPWVVKDQIVIRDIMAVAVTYDHRLIDGRDAVTFLVKVKNLIEDPVRMVLDIA